MIGQVVTYNIVKSFLMVVKIFFFDIMVATIFINTL